MSLFYTSGQAANELGTSQDRIRALCDSGVIEFTLTSGGQRRIAADVVEQLKQDGIPSPPRPLPSPPRTSTSPTTQLCPSRAATRQAPTVHHPPPPITEFSSPDTIEVIDEVTRLQAEVQVLELKQDREEALDYFRGRETAKQLLEAQTEQQLRDAEASAESLRREQAAAYRSQIAEEESARAHARRVRRGERYVVEHVPHDAPSEARLAIHEAARELLMQLDTPLPPWAMTEELLDAEIRQGLRPWRRKQEIVRAITEAVGTLPASLKGFSWRPSPSDTAAAEAAATAIEGLRPAATYEEMLIAATTAVRAVVTAHDEQEAAERDMKLKQSVSFWSILPLRLTISETEVARRGVLGVLNGVAVGASRHALEEVAIEALRPIREALDERQAALTAPAIAAQEAEAQRQAEERRVQADHTIRQAILRIASLSLPMEFTPEEREKALGAVTTGLEALPVGTPPEVLEQTKDKIVATALEAHARAGRKAQLVAHALRKIHAYLLRLENDWDLEQSAPVLAQVITPAIRLKLQQELTGDETVTMVERLMRRLVRRRLEIAPARTGT